MTFPADLDSLILKDEHDKSFAPFSKADQNLKAMKQGVIDARKALEEAKKGPAALAAKMAAGEIVTAADRAAAQAKIQAAQSDIEFHESAVEAAQGIWQRAHDFFNGWSGRAHQPVFDALIDKRIEAAAKRDAALAAVAEAEAEYTKVRDLMDLASVRGAKWPHHLQHGIGSRVVMTEAEERAAWKRPA
ncbi:hypothetical protein ACRAWG_15835 [Methylobacterium sp. P31]